LQITINNTSKIVYVNGISSRIWEGKTSSGISVRCLVARIDVMETEDTSQFDRELEEVSAPSAIAESYPLRVVL